MLYFLSIQWVTESTRKSDAFLTHEHNKSNIIPYEYYDIHDKMKNVHLAI